MLRGGAWIGALERAAVFVAWSPAGPRAWPSCSALKGLAATPSCATRRHTGAAERFIIGTFTSVLWAVACAGVVRLLVDGLEPPGRPSGRADDREDLGLREQLGGERRGRPRG